MKVSSIYQSENRQYELHETYSYCLSIAFMCNTIQARNLSISPS